MKVLQVMFQFRRASILIFRHIWSFSGKIFMGNFPQICRGWAKNTKSSRCLKIIRKSAAKQKGYSEGLRIYKRMGKLAVLCRRRVMTCRGRKSRKQMSYFPSPRKQAGHAWQSLSVGRTLHSSSEVASKISHQCSIQNSGSQIAKISLSTISNSRLRLRKCM